jgi:hypothetical protein
MGRIADQMVFSRGNASILNSLGSKIDSPPEPWKAYNARPIDD